jgi:hypothetical protein
LQGGANARSFVPIVGAALPALKVYPSTLWPLSKVLQQLANYAN